MLVVVIKSFVLIITIQLCVLLVRERLNQFLLMPMKYS